MAILQQPVRVSVSTFFRADILRQPVKLNDLTISKVVMLKIDTIGPYTQRKWCPPYRGKKRRGANLLVCNRKRNSLLLPSTLYIMIETQLDQPIFYRKEFCCCCCCCCKNQHRLCNHKKTIDCLVNC
jgi:hypothetical protein